MDMIWKCSLFREKQRKVGYGESGYKYVQIFTYSENEGNISGSICLAELRTPFAT